MATKLLLQKAKSTITKTTITITNATTTTTTTTTTTITTTTTLPLWPGCSGSYTNTWRVIEIVEEVEGVIWASEHVSERAIEYT